MKFLAKGACLPVRILRVLEALRGTFVCILRVREAPGGVGCLTALSGPKGPGGSAKQGPEAGWLAGFWLAGWLADE